MFLTLEGQQDDSEGNPQSLRSMATTHRKEERTDSMLSSGQTSTMAHVPHTHENKNSTEIMFISNRRLNAKKASAHGVRHCVTSQIRFKL